MKKLLILLFLILYPCVLLAGFSVDTVSSPDSVDTVSSPESVEGVDSGGAASPCPSYYASANLSWDGDHTSGNLYACDSSGNPVLFTDEGSVDIGAYGEGGSNAIKIINGATYMYLQQTAGQYFNETADMTICLKINHSATASASDIRVFMVTDSEGDDKVTAGFDDTTYFWGSWAGEGQSTQTAFATSPTTGTWEIMAESTEGSALTNGGQSVDGGGGYDEDIGDLSYNMTDRPIYIRVGKTGNPPGYSGQYTLIDSWAIIPSYEAACATIMGE